MKTKLFFIGIAALLFASCGRTVIESGDLTLKIDGNMHFKVESSAPGAQKYFDEYQAADILIADEPTTALDVTIQAQILDLLRDLKDKIDGSILLITHDLGVVANVADRIAVMYAGDIVEIGRCDEVFYDPKHPYTWALLSSLPQLGVKGEDLYAIKGTPPNLFNKVRGDAFAPRNPYALKIDFEHRPPYFEVSPTHKARTWLLDPRAPKVDPPAIILTIRNIKRGGIDNG